MSLVNFAGCALVTLANAVLATGCADVATGQYRAEPPPGIPVAKEQGTVIVTFFGGTRLGYLCNVHLSIDGQGVGKFGWGESFAFNATPGSHFLRAGIPDWNWPCDYYGDGTMNIEVNQGEKLELRLIAGYLPHGSRSLVLLPISASTDHITDVP